MKKKYLIEKENISPKKLAKTVHWGQNDELVIESTSSEIEQLKSAIKKVNLSKLIYILNNMDTKEAKNQFIAEEGKLIFDFFKSIHCYTQSGRKYDSNNFKEILRIFFTFDQIITDLAFHKFGAYLAWNKHPSYVPQIRADYQKVERNFEPQQIKQAPASTTLVDDLDDTDSTHMDKDSSDSLIDASTETQKSAISSQKENQPNQRSHILIFSNDNEEKSDAIKNIIATEAGTSSQLVDTILNNFFAWIYEFPEWLQEQIFNSTPIKALIESAEQWNAIYDKKSVGDAFANLLSVEAVSDSVDATKDNINTKATIAETSSAESIDMTMILNEPTVNGWILPTVAIGSGNLFSEDAFNGLVNLNGLDGFNVF